MCLWLISVYTVYDKFDELVKISPSIKTLHTLKLLTQLNQGICQIFTHTNLLKFSTDPIWYAVRVHVLCIPLVEYSSIGWHDFVVVETINFRENETGQLEC